MPNKLTNLLILSHEKEYKYVKELLTHFAHNLPEDVRIFSMGDIAASDERIDVLCSELKQAHIAIAVISSSFLADDLLYKLRQDAVNMHDANILEAVQVLARSVVMTDTKATRPIKTIPLTPLATLSDRDFAYSQIVDFVIDKIDIIRLKCSLLIANKKIVELTQKIDNKIL